MRILFLSFYYRPDLCAGSFRATPLVDALVAQAPHGWHIDVLTTQPNRYHSYTAQPPQNEDSPGLSIRRVELPAHQSGMLDQSRAFAAYACAVLKATAGRDYDLVVATSSRLMTAVLGAWVARRKKAALYLDIRDIFVDTLKDVLPRSIGRFAAPLFSLLERYAIGRADQVNLVSRGFCDYFLRKYPRQRYTYFTNGVDDEFIRRAAPTAQRESRQHILTVLYAGNVGEGQGLHAIVPALAREMCGRVRFRLIGDGGRRRELESAIAQAGVGNVDLLAPVSRDVLIQEYERADILFLHLNDHEAFEKVLPSKLFEYAASGKPVWAGVAGYAAEFIRAEITNATVFPPCDVPAAVRAFDGLELTDEPRREFVAKYGRTAISTAMAAEIIAIAQRA